MKILKIITTIAVLLVFIFPAISYGQQIVHAIEGNHIKKDTLTDNNGVKFIIDKDRIFVKAIDKNGKQLWKTDPAIDNHLQEYRVKRPHIVYFFFSIQHVDALEGTEKEEVIIIGYENNQFGYLYKETGNFIFAYQL
jgi:hypothetical protein